jgi:hypothetical protein
MPDETAPVRCPYCRIAAATPNGLPVVRMIFENRQPKQMAFCSEKCAANYQMGAEG